MAQPKRTPERAAQVLDRAARMRAFKVGIADRRLFDPQIRTANYTKNHPFYLNLDRSKLEPRGVQEVPIKDLITPQKSVSLKKVKAKLPTADSVETKVVKVGDRLYLDDGNHGVTPRKALNYQTVRANVSELVIPARGAAPAPKPAPISASTVYKGMSPLLQVGGILAAGSTAYNEIRRANGTRAEALKGGALASAPGALTMGAAAALAKAAPAVASGLARYNPYVLGGAVAFNMARGAWEGYNAPGERSWGEWAKGQPVPKQGLKGAAIGAAFGAADTLTFGLASYAAGRERPAFETGRILGAAPPRLDDSQKAAFARADQAYRGRQLMQASESGDGKKRTYKDAWTDSLGRNYTRKNMAVRTRADQAA